MDRSRHSRQWFCRIAITAFLLVALAPSISHLLGANRSQGWIEVCSASGVKWVQLAAEAGGETKPGSPHKKSGVDCLYCVLSSAGAVTPPALQQAHPVLAAIGEAPIQPLTKPLPLGRWSLAPSRAPPLTA